MKRLLITGGAGFIGSNFTHYILDKYPDYEVIVYDKLTYAGNLDNLRDLEDNPRYSFIKGDICDVELVDKVMDEYKIDIIVNFAAETHVDRSILEPGSFIQTDVYGTYVLLEAAGRYSIERFHQVSTDEVYGNVEVGSSKESDPLEPRSPYSASKAGGELLVKSYWTTFGTPVTITRGSNNIGPYQYPEKIIPLFITNALEDKPLPIYGDGKAVRDYIYVMDHCEAIDLVIHRGGIGEVYNIGGGNEISILQATDLILKGLNKPQSLMKFVADRSGHDRRYSLDCSKLKRLGWRLNHSFEEALDRTIRWYIDNKWWWRKIREREEYKEYYDRQYGERLKG